jgi:hypothetical protein
LVDLTLIHSSIKFQLSGIAIPGEVKAENPKSTAPDRPAARADFHDADNE